MTWKIERWLAEVFPGRSEIYAEYRSLPPRELAIVSAAVLDVALAELLSLRMAGQIKEIEGFLGLNGDGRAPAGSFGARIQLGLLVGLLTPEDAAILRVIKELRNIFAHRVCVDFLEPSVVKATTKLYALWLNRAAEIVKSGAVNGKIAHVSGIQSSLSTVPEAGQGLLLAVFSVYQAYFHIMHSGVNRIGCVLEK